MLAYSTRSSGDSHTMLIFLVMLCVMFVVNETEITGIFFFNDTATTEIYTLSLHDALPI